MFTDPTSGCFDLAFVEISQVARRLAQISLRNGFAREAEREGALKEAQRSRITTLDYLRARLLVVAGIPDKEMTRQV